MSRSLKKIPDYGWVHREHRSKKGRSPYRPDRLVKIKKDKMVEEDLLEEIKQIKI